MMEIRDIGLRRLMNQRIAGQKFTAPGEVVRWMSAMQAQDYGQSLWGIGLRTEAATLRDVEQAIADGEILRTWPMRGTIHFVPPEDAQWMLELAASRVLAGLGRRRQQLDLTPEIIGRSREVLCKTLSGGKRLPRPEMLETLENAGISTTGQRGYHILSSLSMEGVLCMGPMQGKQQTFVLLDEWAPHPRHLTHEEALAEWVGRFFTSHGPATEQDFARWTGLTLTDTRLGLELTETELIQVEIDSVQYWMPPENPAPGDEPTIFLLPAFDEYLLGYKERGMVLAAEHAHKVVPGNNGMFMPMLVIDGQIVGTWKRVVKKKVVEITLLPFGRLGDLEEQVIAEASAYGRFMELPVSVTVDNS